VTTLVELPRPPRRAAAAVLAFVGLAVGLLVWAKWGPYLHKVPLVHGSGTLGPSILTGREPLPPAPSLQAGWDYTVAYLTAIYPALVAGLLLAAGVEVLLPAGWVRRALGADGVGGALRGSAAALPTMMCTCCAAPVAVGLRRRGAAVVPALAHWLANLALNPVVIAFAVFVLPWQLAAARVGFGVVIVGGLALLAGRRRVPSPAVEIPAAGDGDAGTTTRYLRTVRRLSMRLLPEYLVLVVALGAARGLLPPLGDGATLGVLAVVVLAVAGTLLPVPTGAEVAAAAALLAAGAGAGAATALLLALPVVSLPSVLMVRSVFPRSVLAWTTGALAALSAAGGLTALALTS
jgi:uncharacterized membrane protein YraQ (UPF0718 family)